MKKPLIKLLKKEDYEKILKKVRRDESVEIRFMLKDKVYKNKKAYNRKNKHNKNGGE